MAVLYTPHFVQFIDNNGSPLSGGKLFTYEAGTVTPKATFTTEAGDVPNSNPVVLDSAGRSVVFLDGSYKFRLEDALGNLIRETDDITAFSVQSASVDNIVANFTEDVITAADSIIFADASDSNKTKRDTIQGVLDLFLSSGYQKDRVLSGLVLSNNSTDATNDIDIAAGACVSDDGTTFMTLTAITKRLDDAWSVGTGNGGLDTGSIADTTYHVWVINRPDTNVTDLLFSASASAPTMPTNYTKKKCIGSIIRESAAIVPFIQYKNEFWRKTPVTSMNAVASSTTAALQAFGVPSGIKVGLIATASVDVSANTLVYFSDPDAADVAPSSGIFTIAYGSTNAGGGQFRCFTNTSSQVRVRSSVAARNIKAGTLGWVDLRI